MKLIYFAKEAWEEAYITGKLPGMQTVFNLGTTKDFKDADLDAEIISVFVNSPVTKEVFDRYPNLKCIATRSTGYDHIDIAEAKQRNVTVVTVPSYGANTVAEFAFALLLALSRHTGEAHRQIAETGSFSQAGFTGFDLENKTIGIIGCGRIGVHMAKIAAGFGMHVLVFDMRQDAALAEKYGFTYVSLEDALRQSDTLSLHVPYNEQTHHLINTKNISLIRKGAYLINTARGAVIETAALAEALESGIIAGAGLDVLEEEVAMRGGSDAVSLETQNIMELNRMLMRHPRVIVTPHIAFDTVEAIRRILDTTAENITAYQGGAPQNSVAQ